MYSFGGRLKSLRKEAKLTQEELVRQINEKFDLNINKGMLSKWESDKVEPRMNIIRAFTLYFDINLDDLLGLDEIQSDNAMDTPLKDKKSIQKELQNMIGGLNSGCYTSFDDQCTNEIKEEDKELLIASLENSLRLAKRFKID